VISSDRGLQGERKHHEKVSATDAGLGGWLRRKGQQGPEWQVWDWGENCTWDERLIGKFNAFFELIDCILLSRKIVEGGHIDHWTKFARKFPDKAEFAFTKRILEARKVIFSRTLNETKWSRTELARHPLIDEVDDLKHQMGKTIVAFGGAGFASSLIADDLVDEFQFYVSPIALHQGLSILAQKGIDSDLELLGAETFDSGIVLCRYAPRGRA